MSRLEAVLRRFAEWRPSRVDAFRLECRLDPPVVGDHLGGPLPPEVAELWSLVGGGRLFADRDYGQWGLRLLPPAGAAARKAQQCEWRPEQFELADVVVGEFLGDAEILVVDAEGRTLVALPLDPRTDWYLAAGSLTEFLEAYLAAEGDKYWEKRESPTE